MVAPDGSDTAPGTLAQPLRTIQRAVDLAVPGDTIAVRGGTYALTDNITITTSRHRVPAPHPRRLPGRAGGDRRRAAAREPHTGGRQHPAGRPRGDPPGGLVLADLRPGDRERPVRRLLRRLQQQRLRPTEDPRQLRVRLPTAGRLQRQPDPEPGQLRQPRPAQERRERGRSRHQGGQRHGQRRARAPGCGTTSTTASTTGSSPRRSWSRTRSRTATASTAGTSPTSRATATASSSAAAARRRRSPHTVRNSDRRSRTPPTASPTTATPAPSP